MASFEFNISKGRTVELFRRVDANDPANSALIVVLLASTGLESNAVLKDKDTLADILSGATDEATNTGYSRKVLTDAEIGPFGPDDNTDTASVTIPDQSWTLAADGTGNIGALVICYDNDTTSGTDSDIIPCLYHEWTINADGSQVTAQIPAGGVYTCQ